METTTKGALIVIKYAADLPEVRKLAQKNIVVELEQETPDTEACLCVYGPSASDTIDWLVVNRGFSKEECKRHGSVVCHGGDRLYVCRFIGDMALTAMALLGLEVAVHCHRCGSDWAPADLAEDEQGSYCPSCPDHRGIFASLSNFLRPIP